ncbi:MAG: hypothetical protein AAF943_07215 [Pseudomonadota bacterium]
MSNVVAFPRLKKRDQLDMRTALCRGIAETRRPVDDVFWLKENAELLGMLASSGQTLPGEALRPYQRFYDEIEEKLRFYPQYYRFFVSMCLDLEDLGMDGCKGLSLCRWAAAVGLAEAELSDLQRAEARRLLARRGAAKPAAAGRLGARLRAFIERPSTFALPNKKAAYELTHIVFYLSEYGTVDPLLSPLAITSLEYLGVIAFLDQDHDLLAEVCLALCYAGHVPSTIWMDAVAVAHARITPSPEPALALNADGFHAFLVTGWALREARLPAFEADLGHVPLYFRDPGRDASALRPLSECLYSLGALRSSKWTGMRSRVMPYLDPKTRDILQRAEESTSDFGAFFEQFARASGS